MKYVTIVMTDDAQLHRTLEEAKRHAKKRYSDALAALARRMAAEKTVTYDRVVEFIDNNINAFANLAPLRDDALPPPPLKNFGGEK